MTAYSLPNNESEHRQSGHPTVATDQIMNLISDWMKDHDLGILSDPNQTFDDAGFDSLDSVELAFYLKDKLGVEIDETVLHQHPTFASLGRYVADRS